MIIHRSYVGSFLYVDQGVLYCLEGRKRLGRPDSALAKASSSDKSSQGAPSKLQVLLAGRIVHGNALQHHLIPKILHLQRKHGQAMLRPL